MGFDIRRYVTVSQALDTRDLDWEQAKDYPVTPAERRAIGFFAAIEAYTVVYLRDLLCTSLIEDAEAAAFLPCWAYEEAYHGRALYRFLDVTRGASDVKIEPLPLKRRTLKEHFDAVAAFTLGACTRHFVAVHMTWGALNELIADAAYTRLGEKTQNPILRELLVRIRRDERRHFSFYYHQAAQRLEHRFAQRVCRLALRTTWRPVGNGIAEIEEQDTVASMLFSDEAGVAAAREVDEKIAKLPGLRGFNLFQRAARKSVQAARRRSRAGTPPPPESQRSAELAALSA